VNYAVKIDTPHSTFTEGSPKPTQLQLTKGILTDGVIYFPKGPAGTLHLVVKRALQQLLPANKDKNYALNDCVIPFSLNYPLDQPPYTLEIFTWNDSTTQPHTLTFSINLEPWPETTKKKGWLKRILTNG